jgi:thymidylate synthase
MKAYLDLLQFILDNGEERDDRTNTGTISSFGHQLEFDLNHGFLL